MFFLLLFRLADFTYNGQLKILEHYRDTSKGAYHAMHWTKELFQILQIMYDKGEMRGPYGITNADNIK